MHFWRMVKAHATLAPLLELGKDVLGQKDNPRGTADEFVFLRFGSRSYQQKHGCAIRRSNCQRPVRRGQRHVRGQTESQLVQVKLPAAIRIANENGKGSETKVGILTVRVKATPACRYGRRKSRERRRMSRGH